jgi:hypothetical protein
MVPADPEDPMLTTRPDSARPSSGHGQDQESPQPTRTSRFVGLRLLWDRADRQREAALISLIAGSLGAVLCLGLGLTSAWVGFMAAYLPVSALAAWAAMPADG